MIARVSPVPVPTLRRASFDLTLWDSGELLDCDSLLRAWRIADEIGEVLDEVLAVVALGTILASGFDHVADHGFCFTGIFPGG
jgi:hypothetical protein